MTTFFDACLALAARLGTIREGNATAVNVAYIEDSTKALGVSEYLNGTLYVKDTTPLMLVVTANTAVRISFAALGAAPTAAVGYALVDRDYPVDVIKRAVNDALADIHQPIAIDATLDADSTKLEYTLPAGVTDVIKVEIEIPSYQAGSGVPAYYAESFHYKEINGKLRFTPGFEPKDDGAELRITYRTRQAALSTLTSSIPAGVDFELLVWKAATHALRWGLQKYGQDPDRRVVDRLNEAQQEVVRRGGNKHIAQRDTKLGAW